MFGQPQLEILKASEPGGAAEAQDGRLTDPGLRGELPDAVGQHRVGRRQHDARHGTFGAAQTVEGGVDGGEHGKGPGGFVL